MSMISRQASMSSASSMSHSHPHKIGPWKLGKTLGRGATGRVLLGVHSNTGQKAAVKVVSKSELNEEYEKPEAGQLPYGIEREIIIMKLLTHPNVLRLYDVWETSKALYLVLEYVEGGELFDLLVERGPLHEREAVKYFRQIILGTAYCHALGICHRDLKPENLLLDAALNVKLADFGMAALESQGRLLETSCGSPHYAAPEIVSGLKYHGAASDVWSCGVILFALLTGRLPFDDENIRNLLLKVQAGSFEMPSDLSSEAQDLLRRMLTVDPARRITTPDVLTHPLLAKYPIPDDDLVSVRSLPHPQTAYKSLGSAKNIDQHILHNLSILWHARPEEDIVRCLLADGPNPEKTFYALLSRYRHQDDGPGTPRRMPRSTSGVSTPRRRSRPVSFQRRYGQKSPRRSPQKTTASPLRSPRRSPQKIPSTRDLSLPRNIYNDIVAAESSRPPTLPSKDSIYDAAENSRSEAARALAGLDSAAPVERRRSVFRRSGSRMSMQKTRSIRQSIALKRNSITVKLLSTYAKLASESDWEYMDKQTKRTSATFATLCDKIFNQEAYDRDDELLVDDEEKKAREYEKLMEIERKKHEAELKARRELAKQKRRSKRRSLLSSRKLHISVTEDDTKPAEAEGGELTQPKRRSQLRSISETPHNDDLTPADVANIKRRSATQPVPQRRPTPVLSRRPMSRLDPLWTAFENEKLTRAQDAFQDEFADTRKKRESMVSVKDANADRLSKNSEYESTQYVLPEHESQDIDLSTEYMSEIRKSRLLNSQYNIKGQLNGTKQEEEQLPPPSKTLIGSVNIPKVTRKSHHFSASNKRLSLLTIRSTKESYRDLNSILDAHGEGAEDELNAEKEGREAFNDDDKANMPRLRTSFADRLDQAGLVPEVDEEQLDSASVIDFDEHLANKRTSYYAGKQPVNQKRKSKREEEEEADYTFNDDNSVDHGRGSEELFEKIKLPESKKTSRVAGAVQPPPSTMLRPETENKRQPKSYGTMPKNNSKSTEATQTSKKPLVDSTNVAAEPKPQKRSRSLFRKLSWGSKKTLDEPKQLPSPATSGNNSVEEKRSGSFFRWFSSSSHPAAADIKRYKTILPKQEMMTALYALLNSWSNFGLRNLKQDHFGYHITGSISSNNSFNLKSCRFRIKISPREFNQKSELVCALVKGSQATADTLFKEIERVLEKESVLDK
ncbi:Protein kinase domain family protein [Clavispora lusitaniae]|uniref:Protein kinase domain family protein n=1 Tax=Clavispora lusitaniae TaxID=36911 RepID=UPI00202C4FF1|nr:Protein kinase domain family protein [Clavispora lusitaniae]